MWVSWLFVDISYKIVVISSLVILWALWPTEGEFGAIVFGYVPLMIVWMYFVLYCAANIMLCFTLTSIFPTSKKYIVTSGQSIKANLYF